MPNQDVGHGGCNCTQNRPDLHGHHPRCRLYSLGGLPAHLAEMEGWVAIDGLGWLREVVVEHDDRTGLDFWWWHHCPPHAGKPDYTSPRRIDCSSGERHAITGGALADGDLTIHGGSGSIPCADCGLHGWVREGKWVSA